MNVSDTMDDFDWVCGFGRYRYGVAVRADSPYKTVDDLVAASKKGESVFFGGTSTPNVIALLELGRVTGGKFEQIAYKSGRSEEHTSELQSLMRISYAVFCLKKKHTNNERITSPTTNRKTI